MKNIKLPCFYYPTTVTVIDDNQTFLDNLVDNLNKESLYQQFYCPKEALYFLKNQLKARPTAQEFIQASIDSFENLIQHGKSVVNVNLSDIHNKIYDTKRFELTSVVVVDHDMPGMNGIEFCKNLKDSSIKKIMLTGAADHKIAIKAFNEGIIHKFIMKDDPNVFQAIDEAILELQQEYFSELSELIITNITATSFSYLKNEKFITFFYNIVAANNIVELYLIDQLGSFLLLNKEGELIWFVVKSSTDIENDHQIADDHNAPLDIINMLKEKSKLLFLFSEDDYKQPVEKWVSYLHYANKIDEIPGCYYTLIKNEEARKILRINKDKVYSYKYMRCLSVD